MIGLDTNVLIRYLAQDDPVQSRRAMEIIERRLSLQSPGFLSVVALAETAWVLIERVLQSDALVVESEEEVLAATIALKEGRGSFADALIGALGAKAGCSATLTFDQRALRLPGFQPA